MHYLPVMCVLALALISNVHSKPTDEKLLKKAFLNFIRSLDSKGETRHVGPHIENRSEADYAADETVEARSYEASGESGEDANIPLYLDEDGYPVETAEVVGSEELSEDSAVVIDVEIVDAEKRKRCVCTDGRPPGACQCKVRKEIAAALEQKQRGKCVCTDGRPEGACQCKVSRELADVLEQEQRDYGVMGDENNSPKCGPGVIGACIVDDTPAKLDLSKKGEESGTLEQEKRACEDKYKLACPSIISTPCGTWDKDNCAKSCGQCDEYGSVMGGPGARPKCSQMPKDYKGACIMDKREESDTLEQEKKGAEAVEISETEELIRELKELLEEETRNTQEERAVCADDYGFCSRYTKWTCPSYMKSSCQKSCEVCTETPTRPRPNPPSTGSGGSSYSGTCGTAPKYASANSAYIVGGNEALRNRYPWQVVLRGWPTETSFYDFCGGSVVAPNYIMTASHCLFDKYGNPKAFKYNPGSLEIIAGAHNKYGNLRPAETTQQKIRVAQVIPHEDYDYRNTNNDIALLRLSSDLEYNDYVQPVCLPYSAPTVGDVCTVSGWGRLREGDNEPMSEILMAVRQPILPMSVCNKAFPNGRLTDVMFCAGYEQGGRDSCQGDSGGPLFCESNGKATQYGVVSFGKGCARRGYPGIYASVWKYRDWLKTNSGGAV